MIKTTLHILAVALLVLSCSSDEGEKVHVALEGDDVVLARVNNTPITEYDVERSIRSMFGDAPTTKVDETVRRNVLESLVRSRAIAQAREKELNPEQQAALDKEVAAHREQLLVRQYLEEHTTIHPVTREMVEEHYNKHPEKFGGRTVREYEMISSREGVRGPERDRLIDALGDPGGRSDWEKWVRQLQRRGLPVLYNHGQVDEKILGKDLQQIVRSLGKGEASSLIFIGGRAYVVRIRDEKTYSPRPLSEVSAQIRKSLVPVQMRKSIMQASEQVLSTATVEYADAEDRPQRRRSTSSRP